MASAAGRLLIGVVDGAAVAALVLWDAVWRRTRRRPGRPDDLPAQRSGSPRVIDLTAAEDDVRNAAGSAAG